VSNIQSSNILFFLAKPEESNLSTRYVLWSLTYKISPSLGIAKMMKEWDEMGVWKTDVLNNTSSDNREDVYSGLTIVYRSSFVPPQ